MQRPGSRTPATPTAPAGADIPGGWPGVVTIRTLGRNRTVDAHLRRVALCPLSYEGMRTIGWVAPATSSATRGGVPSACGLGGLPQPPIPRPGRAGLMLRAYWPLLRAARRGTPDWGAQRVVNPPHLRRFRARSTVDLPGFEPGTSALPRRRATNCATGPSSLRAPATSGCGPAAGDAMVAPCPYGGWCCLPPSPSGGCRCCIPLWSSQAPPGAARAHLPCQAGGLGPGGTEQG